HSLLVRTLLNRIASDIRLSLAPTIPPSSSASAGSGGGGGSSTGAGGSSGGMSSSSSSTTPTTAVQINLGVQGQTNQITLYVSRLPTDIDPLADNPVLGSDLRRIDYWLASDGSQPRGLCRNEFRPVTSDDAINYTPPDMPEDLNQIIAEEVRSLQFQYWDGTQWLDTWDGTQPGSDGVTP